MKASTLYRVAAVLLLLFAVAHTLGFRRSDPAWGVDALLVSMRSIHFDLHGFHRTYWDLFVAAGFSVGVFYLFCGHTRLATGEPSGRDLVAHPRHWLGVCSLLCRAHGCELEILVYPPHCFRSCDYRVFGFGGLAFVEVGRPACQELPGSHSAARG